MTIEVFTWLPDQGATKSVTTRTNSLQYGDGYEQSVGDGMNTVIESWTLNFTLRPRTEIDAIDAFLTAKGGVERFDWATPQGLTKRFKCVAWTPAYNHDGDAALSCVFEQKFEP